jgi:hypothetical protein
MAASLRLAEQADKVADGLGDDRLLILSRSTLCLVLHFAGQSERAQLLGAESVQRARQLGDVELLGMSLGMYVEAVGVAVSGPLYAEALACIERSGDLFSQTNVHNNAGCAALETGDIPGARAHLEASIRATEAIGSPHAETTLNLGIVQRAEHDLDGARSILQQTLRIGRRTGDKRCMAEAIMGLACLAGDQNYWHRAAVLHGTAQALLDQTGVPWEPFERATARKASTRHMRPWATTSSSGPTPRHGTQVRPDHQPRPRNPLQHITHVLYRSSGTRPPITNGTESASAALTASRVISPHAFVMAREACVPASVVQRVVRPPNSVLPKVSSTSDNVEAVLASSGISPYPADRIDQSSLLVQWSGTDYRWQQDKRQAGSRANAGQAEKSKHRSTEERGN